MSFTVLSIIVLSFYAAIWFFDSFFKSCMHYPYYAFLEGTGLKIGFLSFTWTTTAFNRIIYRWGNTLKRLLKKWYTFGLIVTLCGFLPFSVWTMLSFIVGELTDKAPEVKAVIPGVNVPMSDFLVYFMAIAISSILHELGHAMAAVQEDVQLLSVGVYVFLFIPVAFVQLNTEHLNSLAVAKRLKIYCAGVWHNIATAGMAALIFLLIPTIFSIAYETNVGVRVSLFTDDSPLKDVRGLEIDNKIIAVNACPVQNYNYWQHCLHKAYDRYGICTTAEFVSKNDAIMMENVHDNDVVECCRTEDTYSFCFEYMEPHSAVDSVLPGQYSCLRPRDMLDETKFVKCNEAGGYACPTGLHCLRPSLNNETYLIIIERYDDGPVLYLGSPYDLHKTIYVDQYFPRLEFFAPFSPQEIEKLFSYIFMFSMGIGFINIIPCYGTDGHHIARNLIQMLAKYLNKDADFVTFFTILTVILSTGVTVPMIIYLFYQAIFPS